MARARKAGSSSVTSVMWASSGGAPAAAPRPSIALLRKKMLTHPLIPSICVAIAPSNAPPAMRIRGAIASDKHPRGHRKEKFRAERHCPQGPHECGVHLCAPVREVREIQPDENSARAACDPHESVS